MSAHTITKYDNVLDSVRNKVIEQLAENNELDSVYKQDLTKVREDDWFVRRFIIHNLGNVELSVTQLVNCLKWRKYNQLYELEDNYFPQEMYRVGCIFIYERTQSSHSTLYIRLNRVKKIPELTETIKMFISHLLFKLDQQAAGHGWVLVFDCQNAQYSNCDLEMAKHLIVTISKYFPTGLAFALAIDFPWILRTFWLMVKTIIPTNRRNLLKFCSKAEVELYIDKDRLPAYLGGESRRPYQGMLRDAIADQQLGVVNHCA